MTTTELRQAEDTAFTAWHTALDTVEETMQAVVRAGGILGSSNPAWAAYITATDASNAARDAYHEARDARIAAEEINAAAPLCESSNHDGGRQPAAVTITGDNGNAKTLCPWCAEGTTSNLMRNRIGFTAQPIEVTL